MNKLNWEAIGVIAAIVFGIIQVFKKEKPDNETNINQSVKGFFFLKNDISQKIKNKDER